MAATQLIAARVTPETKALFRAVADRQQLTESTVLKRLVDLTVLSASLVGSEAALKPVQRRKRDARLYVRLRSEDQRLLRERASARQLAPATYVSVLVRAHLRGLPPLPKDELITLKRSVAELGAIGRNINQIVRVATQGGRVIGASREDLQAILKVCEALRDNVKGLIKANVNSWELGHADSEG